MTHTEPPAGDEPAPAPYRPDSRAHRLPHFVNAELSHLAGAHGARVHLQPYSDGSAYLSIVEQRERGSGTMVDHSAAGYVSPEVLAQLVAQGIAAAAARRGVHHLRPVSDPTTDPEGA